MLGKVVNLNPLTRQGQIHVPMASARGYGIFFRILIRVSLGSIFPSILIISLVVLVFFPIVCMHDPTSVGCDVNDQVIFRVSRYRKDFYISSSMR